MIRPAEALLGPVYSLYLWQKSALTVLHVRARVAFGQPAIGQSAIRQCVMMTRVAAGMPIGNAIAIWEPVARGVGWERFQAVLPGIGLGGSRGGATVLGGGGRGLLRWAIRAPALAGGGDPQTQLAPVLGSPVGIGIRYGSHPALVRFATIVRKCIPAPCSCVKKLQLDAGPSSISPSVQGRAGMAQ